jgi:hypothetical protein
MLLKKVLVVGSFALVFAACSDGSDDSTGDETTAADAGDDTSAADDTDAGNDTDAGGSDPSDDPPAALPMECIAEEGDEPDSLPALGCDSDFRLLASEPADSSLPGALSVKLIIDRVDGGKIHFQDSERYPLHYDFASANLSAVDDLPPVVDQQSFNENYYTEQRRFFLGTITYYEGPDIWVFELAPYDNASPEMVTEAYDIVVANTFFGEVLHYHPSGGAAESVAEQLGEEILVVTTAELFEGIDYQPLTIGRSCGRLVFFTAAELESNYVSFQDIVVLDSVPNDISVAQGIITAEFQTPLSHVNVLSQNRGTPNMGLRGAFENEELRALEGKWITLDVGPHQPEFFESDPADKDECLIQPEPIEINDMDLSVTELTDIKDIYDPDSDVPLKEQVSTAIPAFGGKASHYSALAYIEEANAPKAFAIPIYRYNQFMVENGFDLRLNEMLADEAFNTDPATRDAALEALRDDMELAPINEEFLASLYEKLESDFPGVRMRFRSSTNAEDLGDFTGAGLYTSKSGDPSDPEQPIEDAIRKVWGSIWFFRAFEERAYRGIDHNKVGMALLVHRSFPDEEANGVAATANPFDGSGVEPGFYVNVQVGDNSVVQPEAGQTTDQFVYYFDLQGQPIVFIDHSNLVPAGETVLTTTQTYQLGVALKAIHQFFFVAYGNDNESGWYAMDVEFKFEGEQGEEPKLYVKQARPYPGR